MMPPIPLAAVFRCVTDRFPLIDFPGVPEMLFSYDQ
jgi:hypothetical protein